MQQGERDRGSGWGAPNKLASLSGSCRRRHHSRIIPPPLSLLPIMPVRTLYPLSSFPPMPRPDVNGNLAVVIWSFVPSPRLFFCVCGCPTDGRTDGGRRGAISRNAPRRARQPVWQRGWDRGTERRAKKCRCTARQEREDKGGDQSRDQSPFPTFSFFVFSLLPWVAEMDKGGRHKSFFFVPPKKLFPVREFFENLPKKAQILTISLLFLTFRVNTNLVGVNTALNTSSGIYPL